ncbi:hypothetical protein [Pantoea sp. SGAir0183]
MIQNKLDIEDLKEQIPYYLTQDQQIGLLRALEDFPDKTEYYLGNYHQDLKDMVLQGDIFQELPVFKFTQGEVAESKGIKGIIISNSCDIAPENTRSRPMKVLFAPLVDFEKWRAYLLSKGVQPQSVESQLEAIKEQKVTNIIYLPQSTAFPDSVVFLDDVYQIPSNALAEKIQKSDKLITLSQVGFYIFLFKLSIHFCRFHEKVERQNH